MPVSGTAIFFFMAKNVYADESGDLGWIFDKPFREGGSSRYLTIAFLLCPSELTHLPKRVVKRLYEKRGQSPSQELKASQLKSDEREFFAASVVSLLQKHPEISIFSITVNKPKVSEHIQADPNKLYNYMVKLCLIDYIMNEDLINFIPDPRSIKVASGNSLVDYLQTVLWFELGSKTRIHSQYVESSKSLCLQFIDIVAHIVWRNYEAQDGTAFSIIQPYMACTKELYF
jgi:hypothetical protein